MTGPTRPERTTVAAVPVFLADSLAVTRETKLAGRNDDKMRKPRRSLVSLSLPAAPRLIANNRWQERSKQCSRDEGHDQPLPRRRDLEVEPETLHGRSRSTTR